MLILIKGTFKVYITTLTKKLKCNISIQKMQCKEIAIALTKQYLTSN